MNFEEATSNVIANMAALESIKPTTQEASQALVSLGPAMQAAWQQCLDNDALWAMRAEQHGMLRTWWLRWQLRRKAK